MVRTAVLARKMDRREPRPPVGHRFGLAAPQQGVADGDDLLVANLEFPGGVVAIFSIGTQVQANNMAQLCGSEGYIEIPVPWKPPQLQAEYSIGYSAPPRMDNLGTSAPTPAPARKTFRVDAPATLYALEADDFAASVLDGRPPRITDVDTIGNTRVLDEMRRQLNLPK